MKPQEIIDLKRLSITPITSIGEIKMHRIENTTPTTNAQKSAAQEILHLTERLAHFAMNLSDRVDQKLYPVMSEQKENQKR